MQHIQTIELGSPAASMTFNNISQDFDDLLVLVSPRATGGTSERRSFIVEINGTGSTGRSLMSLNGTVDNATPGADFTNTSFVARMNSGLGSTSNTFTTVSLYFHNYKLSTNKIISVESLLPNADTTYSANLSSIFWDNTSAITSITLEADDNYETGSTASLYGITAGGDGTVTTA